MAEMRWRHSPVTVESWLNDWAERRLGPGAPAKRIALAQAAWREIGDTVYSCPTTQMGQVKSMIESRPRLDLYTGWIPNSDFMPIRRHYPETSLVNAWTKLVEATLPSGSDGYKAPAAAVFDVVDVTRQVLSDLFARLFVQIAGYVYVKTKQGVPLPTGSIASTTLAEEQMQLMLGMIRDLDELLGTQGHMLLGKWIGAARAWGRTDEEKSLLEFNARNLITLWGPRGEIADYASKQWSGLMVDYYLPRWELFFSKVGAALREDRPIQQPAFLEELLKFEQAWQLKSTPVFPDVPQGDPLRLVQKLQKKYKQLIWSTLKDDIYAEPVVAAAASSLNSPLYSEFCIVNILGH
jgi:alpha-N-acetylglucosaminidase